MWLLRLWKTRRYCEDIGNGPTSASKIERSLSMQNDEINWIVNGETAEMTFAENDFRVRVRGEFLASNPNHENYFISTTQVKNNEIEVSININHPLWKPLINNQAIDIKKVIYQIAAVIGNIVRQGVVRIGNASNSWWARCW
jgi:hypothetical protein